MNYSRREFLASSALTASVCKAFNLGSTEPRRPLPSERIHLGVIGCGTMGMGNMIG